MIGKTGEWRKGFREVEENKKEEGDGGETEEREMGEGKGRRK